MSAAIALRGATTMARNCATWRSNRRRGSKAATAGSFGGVRRRRTEQRRPHRRGRFADLSVEALVLGSDTRRHQSGKGEATVTPALFFSIGSRSISGTWPPVDFANADATHPRPLTAYPTVSG